MGQVEPIGYMLDQVEATLEFIGSFGDQYRQEPLPGSPAARESDMTRAGHAVLDAYAAASAHLDAAGDLCGALCRLSRPTVHRYGVFAMARAAIEAGARSWWLLEPGITRDERALRGLRERCRGLGERERLERAMGVSTIAVRRRMVRVQQTANQLGIQRRVGRPPDANDLFAAAFEAAGLSRREGEVMSRLLSGFVHGTLWALHGQTAPQDHTLSGDARVELRAPSVSAVQLAYSIHATTAVLAVAERARGVAFGWDTRAWSDGVGPKLDAISRAAAHIAQTSSG